MTEDPRYAKRGMTKAQVRQKWLSDVVHTLKSNRAYAEGMKAKVPTIDWDEYWKKNQRMLIEAYLWKRKYDFWL